MMDCLMNLMKSLQTEILNIKNTPGSIILGSLSLIGFLTTLKYQIGFLNVLFSFSRLSKPFKISLEALRVNLVKKSNPSTDRSQKDEKEGSKVSSRSSSSWAIITGPTNGIGKEFAIELSKRGFNLFLIGRSLDKLISVKDQILGQVNPNIQIEIETIDLSKTCTNQDRRDQDRAGLEKTLIDDQQIASEDWKRILNKLHSISIQSNISILINNAGLSHSQPIEFQSNDLDRDLNSILNVNVFSVLYLTKLVIPFMLKFNKGLILNVGSFSALIPTPLLATYAGSKGFLYTWSQALGTELEPKGIDVRLLNTYFVASEMSKIKKTSFLIPSPKRYVRDVLDNLISTNLKPYIVTGYFAHSLLEFFLDHFGTLKFWLNFNLKMQLSTLARINKRKLKNQST